MVQFPWINTIIKIGDKGCDCRLEAPWAVRHMLREWVRKVADGRGWPKKGEGFGRRLKMGKIRTTE